MILRFAGLFLLFSAVSLPQTSPNSATSEGTSAPPVPAFCPAGGPIGAIDLKVRSPEPAAEPLPFEKIISLSEGDTVLYSPIVRGREVRHGEISLVLVPARHDKNAAIIVTDPKPAEKPQEWKIEQTISVAAYVYGPEGLSKKKVKNFLSQDDLLIAQLADYAEKTAETEALIQALSDANSSSASVNAALSGFASQYGITGGIDKTAPGAAQAQMLFATMNPQLSTYDPLTPSSSARIGQTASLATVAAGLFFGNPIGLAAGGTAMVLDLRAIAFPGTQFRSSFAQPIPNGLNLCGQRTPAPPHTRVAYIWANRIPNAPVPNMQVGPAHFIPLGEKTPLPIDVADKDWHYLDRARAWTLESPGMKSEIEVIKLANQKSIELDLTKAKLLPGDYHLSARWDWAKLDAVGTVTVRRLNDFKDAKLEASSQDRLLAKSGKTAVTLEDDDFEFTSKVELKKQNDEFATAQPVPFILPKGLRQGPQNHMDVQINTADLDPGNYQLLIAQADNKNHPVEIKVLPSPPEIANLPILVNTGGNTQHFILKGQHLGLVSRLDAAGVKFELAAAAANDSERNLTVQLAANIKPGTALPVSEYLQDRNEPLVLQNALKITGPLPVIASSKLSPLQGQQITLAPGELPAGATLAAMLDVKNIDPHGLLHLSCDGDATSTITVRIGEQTDKTSLQQLSPDQLFLSFDTSALPAGCPVTAVIDNQGSGRSEPYVLAHMVRLPNIEQMVASPDQLPDGKHSYAITGRNLEMIEKAGWDQLTGFDVPELPTPIPGQGQKQSLRINLPDPPTPTAPLYLWLRGDKLGRPTTVLNVPAVVSTTH